MPYPKFPELVDTKWQTVAHILLPALRRRRIANINRFEITEVKGGSLRKRIVFARRWKHTNERALIARTGRRGEFRVFLVVPREED